jgi:hypothetical protein
MQPRDLPQAQLPVVRPDQQKVGGGHFVPERRRPVQRRLQTRHRLAFRHLPQKRGRLGRLQRHDLTQESPGSVEGGGVPVGGTAMWQGGAPMPGRLSRGRLFKGFGVRTAPAQQRRRAEAHSTRIGRGHSKHGLVCANQDALLVRSFSTHGMIRMDLRWFETFSATTADRPGHQY